MGLLTEPNHLLLGATQPLYQIDRSLRFNDDDSPSVTRTFAAGNQKTWTWSGWVKRGNLGTVSNIFSSKASGGSYPSATLQFESGDVIRILSYTGATFHINKYTTQVFRDPTAWYHIVLAVDTTDATAEDRVKLYVNGHRVTSFGTNTNPALNADVYWNAATQHTIGGAAVGGISALDGYMAEIHFIDGTALDPTSFGEFDTNGVWRPINVTGLTYGTNGFYLSFADNTSTTTLGYDDAGSNDWTLNNFSVTAGAGNDSLEDTPTNNYATINWIGSHTTVGSVANGNLDYTNASGLYASVTVGSIGVSGGKWKWQINVTTMAAGAFGIIKASQQIKGTEGTNATIQSAGAYSYNADGKKYNNQTLGSGTAYGATFTAGDIVDVEFDADAGTLTFFKNGASQGVAFTGLTDGPYLPLFCAYNSSSFSANFGQRAFTHTPSSGFSALCTSNLPTPDIENPSSYMNAVTYTGTGSSLGVTGVGFQPDLVWIKGRSGATDHALYDSTRGVQKQLESNTTTDETTEATGLTAFGSDGFTIGALAQVNTSSATYVGWCWKEGVTPGFDVVTYTGTGVARTISHNLGTVPKLIIVKARSTASTDQGWAVYHANNTAAPETDYLLLNSTAATADLDTVWNDTAPTTTVFSIGTNALVNTLNDTYVAYLFTEVEGFSKFGSYTGNGSADGPFVWCGFRPRFIMLKRTDSTADWRIHDAARDAANVSQNGIFPNLANAEAPDSSYAIDFLSNGFKVRASNSWTNASGGSFIFAAFASQPFSAPSNAR